MLTIAKQLLFVGMTGGLAVAVGLAMVFQQLQQRRAAQMMSHQGMAGGAMGPGMMAVQSAGMPVAGMGSMFNANGMSIVDNVQITGASISGSEQKQVQDIWF